MKVRIRIRRHWVGKPSEIVHLSVHDALLPLAQRLLKDLFAKIDQRAPYSYLFSTDPCEDILALADPLSPTFELRVALKLKCDIWERLGSMIPRDTPAHKIERAYSELLSKLREVETEVRISAEVTVHAIRSKSPEYALKPVHDVFRADDADVDIIDKLAEVIADTLKALEGEFVGSFEVVVTADYTEASDDSARVRIKMFLFEPLRIAEQLIKTLIERYAPTPES